MLRCTQFDPHARPPVHCMKYGIIDPGMRRAYDCTQRFHAGNAHKSRIGYSWRQHSPTRVFPRGPYCIFPQGCCRHLRSSRVTQCSSRRTSQCRGDIRTGTREGAGIRKTRGSRETMILHYAASLAFILWYLLAPPATPGGLVDNKAPLLQWEAIDVFDTEARCRTVADIMREDAVTNHLPVAAVHARAWAMKCIASDDPRLTGK